LKDLDKTNNYHQFWYEKFFKVYELVQSGVFTPEENKEQADFIEDVMNLKKFPHASILDVPCGDGRISVELAAKGYEVTGIENNENILRRAIKESHSRKLDIKYLKSDMRNFPAGRKFDAVICWFGSFGYFDDAENEKFVKEISNVLKPGGKFIVDTHSLETILQSFEKVGMTKVGDTVVIEDRMFDFENSRIAAEWTFIKDGTTHKASSSIRIYSYKELIELLKRNGFGNIKAYGSLDKKPFVYGHQRLYLIAEKI
jgi:2-polyprenyl-3-methyl-5-hydroxy-6-metoxy-1,4-benzoquinol methylase